ncbi:hypothetical protein [Nocardia asiatica]|uniref:hypothetical protein n=1 Tax=Nocardia asiatica TaxID=209252 RepID=UPI0005C1D35B|nr:hypothetical protein [Nocardia asiatica]
MDPIALAATAVLGSLWTAGAVISLCVLIPPLAERSPALTAAAALGIPFLWPALLRRVLTAPAPGKETR